ncbi:general odorant-binding protein 99a-like [Ceratitis capitata]|uniref:general odorant-binding protein 99a-like n=1 Tax=Ceratitis capitata TaxID=7213 RepID=UPI000C6C6223|nr:general odorant-binding protein 99a-like [Ceratitis capitata]
MKYFFLILAAFLFAQAQDDWKIKSANEVNDIRRECHKEHPFNEELQKHEEVLRFPDEDVVRNYEVCVFTKWGVFDAETGFKKDRLVRQFEPVLKREEIDEIIGRCADKNEQGSPVDVWVYRFQQCVSRSEIPPNFLKIIGKL